MSLDDRDYMRNRHRTAGSERRRERLWSLTAGKAGASFVLMLLAWVALGSVLYAAFTWVQQKPEASRPERPRPRAAAPDPWSTEGRSSRKPGEEAHLASSPSQRPASPSPRPLADGENLAPAPAPAATSGTIYLCKAYTGGTFWAQAHCNQHEALIERIAYVPAGMTFEQQVELAQQQRRAAERLVQAPPPPGPMQDRIREDRRAARDRQFAIGC